MVDQFTLGSHVVVDDDAIPDLDGPTTPDPTARGRRAEESRHGVMRKGRRGERTVRESSGQ
jgi:hypothetical protein